MRISRALVLILLAACDNSSVHEPFACDAGGSCPAGYRCIDAAVGHLCVLDRCAQTSCDPNATCNDLIGASACVCNPGYQGDGSSCAAVSLSLLSLTPDSGAPAGSTLVSILGTGFVDGATVSFGGQAGTAPTVLADNLLRVATPSHAAGPADVVVTLPGGESATLPGAFLYASATTSITGLEPSAGPPAGGTPGILTGSSFAAGAHVWFGSAEATGVALVDAEHLRFVTPAGSGVTDVTMVASDGSVGRLAAAFTYATPTSGEPTVTNVGSSPQGAIDPTTVEGTNLGDVAIVLVDGQPAVVVAAGAGTLSFVPPPGLAPGSYDITIVSSDGQSVSETGGLVIRAATCTDRTRNGDETDVDCGGSCPHCAAGSRCSANGDCVSLQCTSGICAVPTCAQLGTLPPCPTHATCSDASSGPSCACDASYDGDGTSCVAHVCAVGNGGCSSDAACIASGDATSRSCVCNPGFTGNGISCSDVDECATNNGGCGANAICTNTPGAHTCACPPDFTGDGYSGCVFPPCLTNPPACDPHATCVKGAASAPACACLPGYDGDGTTCDENECITVPFACSPYAVCANTPGSFTCTCNTGFTGDGKNAWGCVDINECLINNGGCSVSPLATCTNTVGSHTCTCPEGTSGNGVVCS